MEVFFSPFPLKKHVKMEVASPLSFPSQSDIFDSFSLRKGGDYLPFPFRKNSENGGGHPSLFLWLSPFLIFERREAYEFQTTKKKRGLVISILTSLL